jgi:hypothetical protein
VSGAALLGTRMAEAAAVGFAFRKRTNIECAIPAGHTTNVAEREPFVEQVLRARSASMLPNPSAALCLWIAESAWPDNDSATVNPAAGRRLALRTAAL